MKRRFQDNDGGLNWALTGTHHGGPGNTMQHWRALADNVERLYYRHDKGYAQLGKRAYTHFNKPDQDLLDKVDALLQSNIDFTKKVGLYKAKAFFSVKKLVAPTMEETQPIQKKVKVNDNEIQVEPPMAQALRGSGVPTPASGAADPIRNLLQLARIINQPQRRVAKARRIYKRSYRKPMYRARSYRRKVYRRRY